VLVNLYGKTGSFATKLDFDLSTATNGDSDVLGNDSLWIRPAQPNSLFYKNGWATGARVDSLGARYVVPVGASILPDLGATSPNAQLQFADGKLTSPQTRNLDISTSNVFTNRSTPRDNGLKLTLTTGTGQFNGNFTHTNTQATAFKGVILQEGANAKGFGYFLSTASTSSPGQSGGVTLLPHP